MPLDTLWNAYRASGFDGVREYSTADALETFYQAILAYRDKAFNEAAEYAAQVITRDPDNRLFSQAAKFLARVRDEGEQDVYLTPDGFAAFIRGGGNVQLYANLSALLKDIYLSVSDLTLLDIGVGDGLALLPALTENIRHITLVEPSGEMLATTRAALDERDLTHESYEISIQSFTPESSQQWEIVQATYSLHNLASTDRRKLFDWVHRQGRRLLIAEFDAPSFETRASPKHVEYILAHYQRGLSEYPQNETLVGQGFLLPVMFSNFVAAGPTLYEQTMDEWEAELNEAGFEVERTLIYKYWWADSYLLQAKPVNKET